MSHHETWDMLRRFTDARIGLGRSGAALPTREVLKFAMAHAQARDAVTTPIDWASIEQGLAELKLKTVRVESSAGDRDTYLRRPDFGRQLSPASRERLAKLAGGKYDILIVIGDGLSSKAVAANAVEMVRALQPHAGQNGWKIGPVLLASEARVALGDDAGEFLGARAVVMLIGERPGLSSPDSLGIYITFAPKVGRKDAERNCISNVRKGGLSYDEASFKLVWLLKEALRRGLTGVDLKDESSYVLEAPKGAVQLPNA